MACGCGSPRIRRRVPAIAVEMGSGLFLLGHGILLLDGLQSLEERLEGQDVA